MSATIFIDGDAGTTGLRIRELLADRTGIEVFGLGPDRRKDPEAKKEALKRADVAILCLPDDAARESVAIARELGVAGPRILDASTAHRVDPEWVYGFPELCEGQGEAVSRARLVANPGCYATGAIALLRPLVDEGLIPRDFPISINAVSGYSGGGRSMIEAYEADRAPPFELYALKLEHKHVPEIVRFSGLERRPLFVPSVGNFRQGMLVSIPLILDALPASPAAKDLIAALEGRYRGSRFVRVVPVDGADRIDAEGLNGTNELELRVFANSKTKQAVLVARLDNLGKGAAGAALQNLDLMLGASN